MLLIENNLKFKFTNGDILKWNRNKVTNQCAKENAVCVKRLGNTCICSVAASVLAIWHSHQINSDYPQIK